ncbi:TonB-dependent receptor plug domain-containing protein, partial [Pontibacter toksunensis]
YYDDNTPATASPDTLDPGNQPDRTWLPGIFVQDEISLSQQHKLLLGMRYDYNSRHGDILTPKLAYKWAPNDNNILRLNSGTGFRVVNLFTEEHAALTGSRIVDVQEELDPEKSYNVNVNYIKKVVAGNGAFIGFDATAWYTYFNNRIIADYDTDPNRIIYANLRGHAVTQGFTLNMDVELLNGLKVIAGGTYMDVYSKEEDESGSMMKQRQVLTERWT